MTWEPLFKATRAAVQDLWLATFGGWTYSSTRSLWHHEHHPQQEESIEEQQGPHYPPPATCRVDVASENRSDGRSIVSIYQEVEPHPTTAPNPQHANAYASGPGVHMSPSVAPPVAKGGEENKP